MEDCAPILVTVYLRLYTLKRCIEALRGNKEAQFTDLYVASDGAVRPEHEEIIEKIREYVKQIKGFKSVTLLARSENWGSVRSSSEAFAQIVRQHGRIIFMEDDILPSKYYLNFMNVGLDFYKDNKKVYCICAYKSKFKLPRNYSAQAFLLPRFSPWGYATWLDRCLRQYDGTLGFKDVRERYDRWLEFKTELPEHFHFLEANDPLTLGILKADSQGKITAGDARIEYFIHRANMVCVYPRQTMSNAMPTGKDAEHAGIRWSGDEKLAAERLSDFSTVPVKPDERLYRAFLSAKKISLYKRVLYAFAHEGVANATRYYIGRVKSYVGLGN